MAHQQQIRKLLWRHTTNLIIDVADKLHTVARWRECSVASEWYDGAVWQLS